MTGGERHDGVPALELFERCPSLRCVLADKAYDSNRIRSYLRDRGSDVCIPDAGSRIRPLPHDKQLYKARSEVECTFSLLKQFRRFATRYEKTLRNYTAIVSLCCSLLWLRI